MSRPHSANRSQLALQDYLDALLVEATEPTPLAVPSRPAPARAAVKPVVPAEPAPLEDNPEALSDFEAAVLEEQIRDAAREPKAVLAEPRRVQLVDERPRSLLNSRLLEDVELKAAEPVQAPPVAKVPTVAAPLVEVKPAVVAPVAAPVQSAEVAEVAPPEPAKPAKARRDWADEAFECLLFEVGGLTLAVPLISLGSIYPLTTELTPLFGQPDWFMGILPSQVGNLKVVNTGLWVMPERYEDSLKDGYGYVISIEGYDWGLAVTNVRESIRLQPEQVKWRSSNGQRPWLAGTVIDHMCALMDVAELAGLIASGATRSGAQHSSRL